MAEATPKKKPFKFEITYELFTPSGERLRNVLLRENPGASQALTLGIVNALVQEKETITLHKLTEVSESKYHFKLQFAPGTLAKRAISVVGEDWAVTRVDSGDGAASLYVAWLSEDVTLAPEEMLMLVLQSVSAAPAAGPGVTLELSWKKPDTSPTAGSLLSTTPLGPGQGGEYELSANLPLGVRNRLGKPDVPLRAGFVGDNRVLNVTGPGSTLLLRLANTAPKESVNATVRFHYDASPGLSSQLLITLPVGRKDTHPWALGTADQIKDVVFGALEGWKRSGPEASDGGTRLTWTFTPTKDVELAPEAFLELSLSKLLTSHPDGPTHLLLRYSAVPGYWDGEIVCPIEKAPLVFGHRIDQEHDDSGNVGIGSSQPGVRLAVNGGDVRLNGAELHNSSAFAFRSHMSDAPDTAAARFFKENSTTPLLELLASGGLTLRGSGQTPLLELSTSGDFKLKGQKPFVLTTFKVAGDNPGSMFPEDWMQGGTTVTTVTTWEEALWIPVIIRSHPRANDTGLHAVKVEIVKDTTSGKWAVQCTPGTTIPPFDIDVLFLRRELAEIETR